MQPHKTYNPAEMRGWLSIALEVLAILVAVIYTVATVKSSTEQLTTAVDGLTNAVEKMEANQVLIRERLSRIEGQTSNSAEER